MIKIREYETLLHTKAVNSKNKACGQKWRIKSWKKMSEKSKKWERVCTENT